MIPTAYGLLNSMDTRFVQYSNQSETVYSKLIIIFCIYYV